MAFPTTGVLDDFNRADGGVGASWTNGVFGEASTLNVASNQCSGSGAFNTAWWDLAQFGPDCEVYATLAVHPATATHLTYMGLRTQTPGSGAADCYELVHVLAAGTDTVNLYRVTNGGQTLLGAAVSLDVPAGDAVGMEMVGTTLTLYHKPAAGAWTAITTRTDATYSTGFIFIGMQSTVSRWDDFGGGTVVAGGGEMPPGLGPVVGMNTTLMQGSP